MGRHGMRFGFEWQYERSAGFLEFVEPASMVLYSPELVRGFNADPRLPPQARIPLPDSFRTLDDILQLPLVGFSVGFGDPTLPPRFTSDDARHDHLWRAYWQDSWPVRSRFTLNFGLSYVYHADLANHELSKPAFLEPLLGANGLAPTRRDRNNFGPMLGFAWNVSRDNRTVVRAGSGVYYDLPLDSLRLRELSTIGARGKGLLRLRGERVERSFAHCYETGGMRRLHLRGRTNILKRLLVHVGAFNLSLALRKRLGAGTPRGLADRMGGLEGACNHAWGGLGGHRRRQAGLRPAPTDRSLRFRCPAPLSATFRRRLNLPTSATGCCGPSLSPQAPGNR